jgi:hypothetical protein
VATAWGVLAWGMHYSHTDREALYATDAGDRFGLNFDTYLPFYALTLLIGGAVLIALIPAADALAPLAVSAVLLALFAGRLLGKDLLIGLKPQLPAVIVVCLLIDLLALTAVAGSWEIRRTDKVAGKSVRAY